MVPSTATGSDGAAPERPARRILILAPFPPDVDGVHGGTRALAQLIGGLAARHDVALAYLRASDEAPVADALVRCCTHVIEGRRAGSIRSSIFPLGGAAAVTPGLAAGLPLWVAGRRSARFGADVRTLIASWKPDVVQAEFSAMGQYLLDGDRLAARTLVTFHEPGTAAAEERRRTARAFAPFWTFEARRWRRFERALLRRIDAAVAFTSRDAAFLRLLEPTARVEIVSVGVHVPAPAAEPVGGAPRVMFAGNFVHAPNVDAAHFLIDEIAPLLHRGFPSAEVWIVGAGAPRSLARRATPRIHVTGYVPEMADYLERASVVVAPIRRGGGVRVKVLEAMAAGKAVVTTNLGAEGIDAVPGRDFLLADGAASFSDAVAQLLRDPARRGALGRAARARIVASHTGERAAAAYEAVYDRLPAAHLPAG